MAYLGGRPARTAVTSAQITDGVVTAAKLATNSVTTVKIAAANVTTAKITDANVTTAKLAASSALVGKNLVQNGAMTIAQRGTVTGLGAANAYGLDRWAVVIANVASRVIISQDTDTPAGYAFSQKIDCTTVDSSVATNDLMSVGCKVEGQTTGLQNLLWGTSDAKTVTLSFWAKTDRTGGGNMGVTIQSAGTDYYATSVAITSTWTKFTVVVPGSENTVTQNDNAGRLQVSFTLISGSTFIQTAETWTTSSAWAVSGQTNFMDNTANNVWFTGVQLEVGSVATDFEHEDISVTLAKCQRYLEIAGGEADALLAVAQCRTTTAADGVLKFRVKKRANPTGTVANATSFGVQQAGGGGQTVTALSVSLLNPYGCRLDITVAANLAAGNATVLRTNAAGQKITFSAEL